MAIVKKKKKMKKKKKSALLCPNTAAPGAMEIHCCITGAFCWEFSGKSKEHGLQILTLLLRSYVASLCLSFPACVMGAGEGQERILILKSCMSSRKKHMDLEK